jgi:hypothetical protein
MVRRGLVLMVEYFTNLTLKNQKMVPFQNISKLASNRSWMDDKA